MDVSIAPKGEIKGTVYGDFGIEEQRAKEIFEDIMQCLKIQKLLQDAGGEACVSTIIASVSERLTSHEELFFASYTLAMVINEQCL